MLTPYFTKQFRKDIKKMELSGRHSMEKLKTAMQILVDEEMLSKVYRDHRLSGYFKDRRECHIEPDWLLVYKINKKEKEIIFERTGSHADLFQ
jgi:mRNA interferase YafQ